MLIVEDEIINLSFMKMKRSAFIRTSLVLSLVVIFGALLAGANNVRAEDGDENRYFVDANAGYGGDGSREHPFRELRLLTEALRNPANTKSEAWITGTFTESLMLDPEMSGTPEQPLLIKQWDGEEQAFIDTTSHPDASAISYNGANYVTIDGLHAKAGGSDTGSLPIFVNNSTGAIVRNGRFFGGGESGTCLSFSRNVLVEGNIFEDNEGSGILIPEVSGAIIRNNIIRNNARDPFSGSIFISGSLDIVIEENVIENNVTDGIFAPGVTNLTLERNDITGNGSHGIELWGVAGRTKIIHNRIVGNGMNGLNMGSREPSRIDVAGNIFAQNLGGGTYLNMSPQGVTMNIVNNTFLDNGPYAISVDQFMAYVNVYNNILMGHDVGVQLIASQIDRIKSDHNDLFGNPIYIQFSGNAQDPWKGWSDWRDLGNDQNSLLKNPGFTTEQTCVTPDLCGSYHLSSNSSLINRGKRIGNELFEDIDGEVRTYNRIDIGADEFVPLVN